MTKIISFSGISNSGKTTLIEGLCKILIPKFKVSVIKHDPKNKVVFDVIGKDSHRFFESGADIAIISPNQTTIRFHKALQHNDILDMFNYQQPLDYLFIEGFKTMQARLRICVIREEFVESDIKRANALAVPKDRFADFRAICDCALLDLNNHKEVLEWIDSQK